MRRFHSHGPVDLLCIFEMTATTNRLELRLSTSLHAWHMEVLEIVSLVVILIAALILGGIWTATVVHWLRSTDPLR